MPRDFGPCVTQTFAHVHGFLQPRTCNLRWLSGVWGLCQQAVWLPDLGLLLCRARGGLCESFSRGEPRTPKTPSRPQWAPTAPRPVWGLGLKVSGSPKQGAPVNPMIEGVALASANWIVSGYSMPPVLDVFLFVSSGSSHRFSYLGARLA